MHRAGKRRIGDELHCNCAFWRLRSHYVNHQFCWGIICDMLRLPLSAPGWTIEKYQRYPPTFHRENTVRGFTAVRGNSTAVSRHGLLQTFIEFYVSHHRPSSDLHGPASFTARRSDRPLHRLSFTVGSL